jgi:hypothetical protein
MIQNGEYVAWFKTPAGEGTGIVYLANGDISGGDSVLSYSGCYEVDQDCFTATLCTRRHTAGHPSLFGIDEVEIKLTGQSKGTTAHCSGTAKQAPELPFHATLIRVQDPAPASGRIIKPRFAGSAVDLWQHLASQPATKA